MGQTLRHCFAWQGRSLIGGGGGRVAWGSGVGPRLTQRRTSPLQRRLALDCPPRHGPPRAGSFTPRLVAFSVLRSSGPSSPSMSSTLPPLIALSTSVSEPSFQLQSLRALRHRFYLNNGTLYQQFCTQPQSQSERIEVIFYQ